MASCLEYQIAYFLFLDDYVFAVVSSFSHHFAAYSKMICAPLMLLSAYEFAYAALVCCHGIGSCGDGTAYYNVVGTDLVSLLGGHYACLVTYFAVSKTDTGGYGQELLTQVSCTFWASRAEHTTPSRPAALALLA